MSCDIDSRCIGCKLLEPGVACKPFGEIARVPKRYASRDKRRRLFREMGCQRGDLIGLYVIPPPPPGDSAKGASDE